MNTQTQTLKERWDTLKKENPRLRIRNAAEQLKVSEVELLALQIGDSTTRLRPEFQEILCEIEKLGKVMALTRNNECVHERKGVYANPDFTSSHVGLFVNEDIDMRIFLSSWAKAFAVVENAGKTTRKSLQFFAEDGDAVHKIYLVSESNEEAFDALIEKFKAEDQSPSETVTTYIPDLDERLDEEVDVENFQDDWRNLTDTHDFFGLLKKYGLSRTQALRLAPDVHYATQAPKEVIVEMLEQAVVQQIPIMVFVGNRGNIQIHTGEIYKTLWHENWYNVLDPDFNMHLAMDKIAQTWIVRKPTQDGEVTSIEAYNEMGELIVQFFGKRKPGIPEMPEWKALIKSLV